MLQLYRKPAIFSEFSLLVAAESTRHGGVSVAPYEALNLGKSTNDAPENVEENRRRLAESLGFEWAQVALSYQVHSDEVLLVEQAGVYQGYDALITQQKKLVLAVSVADCTPILLYDSRQQAVAAIHAGWRGTAKGIVSKTLHLMQQHFGTKAADCYAYVGTCIDECSFEVGKEVADAFDAPFKRYDATTQKYLVDLKAANRSQLLAFGLVPSHIETSAYSTILHNHDYFSHRAEKGITGRFMALISMMG